MEKHYVEQITSKIKRTVREGTILKLGSSEGVPEGIMLELGLGLGPELGSKLGSLDGYRW